GVVVHGQALADATCLPGHAPQVSSCRLRRGVTWFGRFSDKQARLPAGFPLDRVFVYRGWAFARTPLGGEGWTRANNLDCASATSAREPPLGSWVRLCRNLYGAALMGDDDLRVGLIRAPATARVVAFEWSVDGSWTVGLEVIGTQELVGGLTDHVVVQTT